MNLFCLMFINNQYIINIFLYNNIPDYIVNKYMIILNIIKFGPVEGQSIRCDRLPRVDDF